MTSVDVPTVPADAAVAPPFSRALRIAAGLCLVFAGLLNGLPQALVAMVTGDLSFSEQIAWGAEHPLPHGLEQTALVASSLVMLPGLLGLAHVCRFRSPALTAVATVLVVWGMWGFGNVLAMGYVAGSVAPPVLSVDIAVALNEGLGEHAGVVAVALVPHLLGSFGGLLLLCVAIWRSRVFPRVTVALLAAFLIWDFGLPMLGPVDPHWLLVVAWGWLGVRLARLPDDVWRGRPAPVQRSGTGHRR
jgi:hypothetical protein